MIRTQKEYVGPSRTFHGSIDSLMGTRLEILVSEGAPEAVSRLWEWLCVESARLQKVLDRFDPDSELSILNRSVAPVRAGETLSWMIRTAIRYHRLTEGLFDVAKGNLNEVSIDDSDLVDLGGRVLDFGGSSILGLGHHPFGDCWTVGVRNPFRPGVLEDITLRNQAMSTSGNTPSYGAHIINPFTGEYVTARRQVTVVSEDALDAEVLSTTLMIAGEEQAERVAARFPGCSARFYDV